MASPPRSAREEERRLNLRTLVIASAASATAALVTSRLWIAGTWLAAAMTPVIVTLVSELLRRPTERITRGLTSDSPALPDPDAPARRVAERMRADAPQPDPDAPHPPLPGHEAPVRIYRTEPARPAAGHKRKIAYRAVLVTAALAFAIGAIGLTVAELIAGNSFGKSDRRTTFVPTTRHKKDTSDSSTTTPSTTEQTDTTEQPTTTETTPETDTTTTPTTETTPPGEPAPSGTDTTTTAP
jgi:hypothetical protein